MLNVSHKDFACLMNMYNSVQKIIKYSSTFNNADDFNNDTISFDTTMINFIVVGEMVEKLSQEFYYNNV